MSPLVCRAHTLRNSDSSEILVCLLTFLSFFFFFSLYIILHLGPGRSNCNPVIIDVGVNTPATFLLYNKTSRHSTPEKGCDVMEPTWVNIEQSDHKL